MKNQISKFVLERLDKFRHYGLMYGSNESVEGQAIQLLEMENYIKYPGVHEDNPNLVLETYRKQLKLLYKNIGPFYLCDKSNNFYEDLYKVCIAVRKQIGTDSQ